MSPEAVLEEIKRLTRLNRLILRSHARERMKVRHVKLGDIRCALLSASSARWQHEQETWRIEGGRDLDEDDLVVIVALEADVIIVTVF